MNGLALKERILHDTHSKQQCIDFWTKDARYESTILKSVSKTDCVFESGARPIKKIDILLITGFSLVTLASIVEPLCAANEVSDRTRFNLRLVTPEPGDVQASSGLGIGGVTSVSSLTRDIMLGIAPDLLIICGGAGVPMQFQSGLIDLLRSCKRQKVSIAGMGNAAWLLAEAGVLSDGACALHWKSRAAFLELHHEIAAENVLFVKSGPITCCGGELAAFDFIIDYIAEICGPQIARKICQHFLIVHCRDGDTRQPSPGNHVTNCNHNLDQMVELMAQNLEEPLSIDHIADAVSLSRRQVERTFSKYTSTTPGRFYKGLRMQKARQLIEQTTMSIIEIAVACGFASTSHFAASFKSEYGVGPLEMRKLRKQA